MKKILLLLCLFPVIAYSQSTQKGVTLEYQGKNAKTTLGGVQIIAGGASEISNPEDGTFTLVFQTLKSSDKVAVNRIAKTGYVLFNKDVVDEWSVNEKATFRIVLCKSEEFDNLVADY